ncbi:unannotated protein [freshwater metagenome]|uniref:Unannotated protein n=1 Tax=freshwater metagenome TaxID=449393 RepID=A0A6J6ZWK7_9ZZZZ
MTLIAQPITVATELLAVDTSSLRVWATYG